MTTMQKTAARAGFLALAVFVGVLNGSPFVVPVIAAAVVALYRLVDYGAREVERGLNAASAERVARLTWELRTAAAERALWERRRPAAPAWPTGDPDDFMAQLETALVPGVVPVPPEPEPVVFRGPKVDEFLFADGGLLCVPAALRLYRYADTQ